MRGDTILLIDDEQSIIDNVEFALRKRGYTVMTALDGDEGLRAFRSGKPDLVLLDIKLPGLGGFELLRRMRELRPDTPVILLTSLGDEYNRVAGLEMGADDYVSKPFSLPELVARCGAVLRRTRGESGRILQVGPLALDPDGHTVSYHGRFVPLSALELRLLECLMRHPARVFSRPFLVDTLYDGEAVVTDRSIDAQVKRLRRKLTAVFPEPDPVETVYGLGYKLNQHLEGAG